MGIPSEQNSAPDFLKWLLYVSPVSWVTEMIAVSLYGDNAEAWGSLQLLFGFEKVSNGEWICIAICVACIAIFRLAQRCSSPDAMCMVPQSAHAVHPALRGDRSPLG